MKQAGPLFLFLYMLLLSQSNAILITMSDGTILQGDIIDYNEEFLSFQTVDESIFLEISWSELNPKQVEILKKEFSLEPKAPEARQVKGYIVYLKRGGIVEGVLQEKKSQVFVIKNRSGKFPIPKRNILKLEKKGLSLTEVYTPSELYVQARRKFDLKSASGHMKLALFLLRTKAYEKAKNHLEEARRISPSLSSEVETILIQITEAQEKNEKRKWLQLFHTYQRTHRYKRASEALDKIKDDLSEEEYLNHQKELLSSQEKHLPNAIAQAWLNQIQRKVSQISFDRKINLEEAQENLFQTSESEVIENLVTEFSLSVAEVKAYFDKRSLSSPKRFSYGSGTFIVGLSGKKPKSSQGVESWEKIKELAAQKITDAESEEEVSPEGWWEKANSTERRQWLMARYLEARMQVESYQVKNCPHCSSRGTRKKGRKNILCPRCQGHRFDRTVVGK